MREIRIALVVVAALMCVTCRQETPSARSRTAVTLSTGRLLDGQGGVLAPATVVIDGGRILEVRSGGAGRNGTVYDLSGYTVLPGLIDTHVHIAWHFDRDGRLASRSSEESAEEATLSVMENAYQALMSGFTTVQSMGSPEDGSVRDAIRRGRLPGPRLLTSLGSITERTGRPAEIRQAVRDFAARGADLIKIFASQSIRVGGAPTLSQEQLDAACSEARAAGLRTAVHAHSSESARRAVRAGCTVIEHGALLDRGTLEMIAESGTYFDPNIYLVTNNYLTNKERFLGIGSYTEEGFRAMEDAVPVKLAMFREALTVPGLKVLFGTDGLAGAFGRLADELIYRVEVAGQDPMAAVVSATSLAAESLELGDEIGTIAPGMQADIIALDGNPLEDIAALRRVVFVMKGGVVYQYAPLVN